MGVPSTVALSEQRDFFDPLSGFIVSRMTEGELQIGEGRGWSSTLISRSTSLISRSTSTHFAVGEDDHRFIISGSCLKSRLFFLLIFTFLSSKAKRGCLSNSCCVIMMTFYYRLGLQFRYKLDLGFVWKFD